MIPLSKLAAAADLSYVKESIVSDTGLNAALYTKYMCPDTEEIYSVIAFRGTDTLEDWLMTNFQLMKTKLQKPYGHQCKVRKFLFSYTPQSHMGFYYAYLSLRAQLLRDLGHLDNLYFVGHSMGGCIAALAAMEFKNMDSTKNIKLVTFGSPKLGNHALSVNFKKYFREENITRVVKMFDPVPSTPVVGYRHIPGEVIRLGNWNPIMGHHMPHYYKLCKKLRHLI